MSAPEASSTSASGQPPAHTIIRSSERTGKVTIRDVARCAGVAPATVSRALSEASSTLVKPATRELVRRTAKRLGYRTNVVARSLRASRTHTVAVVLPDITYALSPQMVRGVADTLDASGYRMLVAATDNDKVRETAVVEAMLARQVDGLVLVTSGRAATIARLRRSGRPFVLVHHVMGGLRVPAVASDDRTGAWLVATHLVGLGHRRIGELSGPRRLCVGAMRHKGIVEGLARAGAPLDSRLSVQATAFSVEAARRAMRKLLRRGAAPTAVVCGDDLLALGCLDALAEHSLRVPEDVSVVGYNDMPMLERLAVPLTTIRVAARQMGQTAGGVLNDLLEGNPPPAPRAVQLLGVELVVRGSTAPPRACSR